MSISDTFNKIIPKNRTQFGAGVISIKNNGSNFVALVLNGGIVDDSWRGLAEKVKIEEKKWWVFSFPTKNAKIDKKHSVLLKSNMKGYGFNDEKKAVKKFDSLSQKKIGEITKEVLADNKF